MCLSPTREALFSFFCGNRDVLVSCKSNTPFTPGTVIPFCSVPFHNRSIEQFWCAFTLRLMILMRTSEWGSFPYRVMTHAVLITFALSTCPRGYNFERMASRISACVLFVLRLQAHEDKRAAQRARRRRLTLRRQLGRQRLIVLLLLVHLSSSSGTIPRSVWTIPQ